MARTRTTLVLTMAILAGAAYAQAGIVANPGFEVVQGGLPASWSADTYLGARSTARFGVGQGGAFRGERFAWIESDRPDDAKLVQRVTVKPNAIYRISCSIRAAGCGPEGLGANLSALGIVETSQSFLDTGGEWRAAELWGRTGPAQTSLSVTARLGGYGRLGTGRAEFDELHVEEVRAAPAGVHVASFAPVQPVGGVSGLAGAPSFGAILLAAAAAALAGLAALRAFGARGRQQVRQVVDRAEGARIRRLLWSFLGLAALVRLALAAWAPGHPNDAATFGSWAVELAERGIPGFYSRVSFCDYPPGYLYVLALAGTVARWVGAVPGSPGFALLLRIPPVVADIALCVLAENVGRRRIGARRAALLAALLAASPALVVNSALWGQVDSVLALLVLLALLAARRRRLAAAAALCALAVLVKPWGLVCVPILLGEMLRRRDPKDAAVAVLAGAAVLAVGSLPFAWGQGPLRIESLYTGALGSYPYATLNAANLYGLLGGNWVSETQGVFFVPFRVSGWLSITAVLAGGTLLACKARGSGRKRLLLVGFLVALGVYTLAHEMHERYLLLGFVLCLFAFLAAGDRRLLAVWIGMGAILFVNQAAVLDLAVRRAVYGIAAADPLFRLLSLAEVALFAASLRFGIDMALRLRPRQGPELEAAAPPSGSGGRLDLGVVDRILLVVLTGAAAALAFPGLGSTTAPQTFSTARHAGEAAAADLGGERHVRRVSAYVGLGEGGWLVELSRDGERWETALRVEQESIFGMVEWRVADPSTTARYLRVTAERPGLALGEVGLFDAELRRIPLEPLPPAAPGSSALFDEQGLTVAVPSHANGMYFDETYFARSAYEGIVGIEPTETTHPPLGKLIIGLGIRIFGMTPWGWRFMGALASVLVVPLAYLLARSLFGEPRAAALAAILVCLDFMRFVQGRMATVDSFVLAFVLLAAFCLHRFWRSDLATGRAVRGWLWLAAAGLSTGAAAACKWIGAYALPGMLLVVAASLRRQWSASRTDPELAASFPLVAAEHAFRGLVCLLVLPLAVYAASYLPAMAGHSRSAAEVVAHQARMLSYHASMSETRWYASTWWEWPLLVRPIWLSADSVDVPAGRVASIVTMGSPVVWWLGFAGVLATGAMLWWRRDPAGAFPLVAFLCMYLPWILVPRPLLFIYHYFSAVPFMVLCLVYVLRRMEERRPRLRAAGYAVAATAVALFALFYPVLAGLAVPQGYARFLQWLPTWVFFA